MEHNQQKQEEENWNLRRVNVLVVGIFLRFYTFQLLSFFFIIKSFVWFDHLFCTKNIFILKKYNYFLSFN